MSACPCLARPAPNALHSTCLLNYCLSCDCLYMCAASAVCLARLSLLRMHDVQHTKSSLPCAAVGASGGRGGVTYINIKHSTYHNSAEQHSITIARTSNTCMHSCKEQYTIKHRKSYSAQHKHSTCSSTQYISHITTQHGAS